MLTFYHQLDQYFDTFHILFRAIQLDLNSKNRNKDFVFLKEKENQNELRNSIDYFK